MSQVIFKQHNWDTDLFLYPTYITGFTTVIEVTQPSVVTIQGHVNLHHRGIVNGAVGYATWLSLESASDVPSLGSDPGTLSPYDASTRLDGSVSAGNIRDVQQHYGETVLDGYAVLQPGAHRITVQGVSHSDLAPTTDGLIEVHVEGGKGLNCMIIRVDTI